MPRILVLGATGYLGSSVSQSLLLTGQHKVYGLCRSASKASSLYASEIIPIICSDPANTPQPYLDAIRREHIDVIVDCTAAYGDSAKFLSHARDIGRERIERFKAEGIDHPPRLGYVYLSGAWVHGDSWDSVSDLDPVGTSSARTPPLDLVAWRPELERMVLAARDTLDVLIFRPAQMYGRASSAWSALWGPIAQAVSSGETSLKVPAPESSKSPVVHVDDVADAICRGVGRIQLFGGTNVYPVFDLVSTTENIRDILEGFAKAVWSEGKGEGLKLEFVGPGDDVYLKALGSTVVFDSARARELLGWVSRRNGLVRGMGVYAAAWKAGFKAA
jgi:nucleoside-diphosphate-sugar epimerase